MEQDKELSLQKSNKNLDSIGIFDGDSSFEFIFKKTEKLVSAVYMVTQLFPETEPMKIMLRNRAGELVSFLISSKTLGLGGKVFIQNLKLKIGEVVSFLEISANANLISQMNAAVINQEFASLVSASEGNYSHKSLAQGSISESFFAVKNQVSNRAEINKHVTSESGQEIKDNDFLKDKSNIKRSNRQNIIINLLKKRKDLTIKDIALVIKDCSEKTIQRELISFIGMGVLKRTGERRWSKYSLA